MASLVGFFSPQRSILVLESYHCNHYCCICTCISTMTIFIASRPHLMNVAQELTIITVIPACLVCEPTFTYNVVHCYLPQFSCKKATSLYLDSGKNGWIFRSKYVKSAIFRWIYKEVLSINLKLVARKKGLFQNAFKHLSICGKITFDAILQMIGFCAIGFFS